MIDTERDGQIVLFVESCRAPIAQDDATPAHWMTSSWLSHGLSKASRRKPGMPVFSLTACVWWGLLLIERAIFTFPEVRIRRETEIGLAFITLALGT